LDVDGALIRRVSDPPMGQREAFAKQWNPQMPIQRTKAVTGAVLRLALPVARAAMKLPHVLRAIRARDNSRNMDLELGLFNRGFYMTSNHEIPDAILGSCRPLPAAHGDAAGTRRRSDAEE
jgi:hypothetical protein